MRPIDQRLEVRQVDFDDLVVVGSLVGAQFISHCIGSSGDVLATGGTQILGHVVVVSEHGTCRADFGTHVADRCFAGGRDRVSTRSEVFDDGAGAAFDGEQPCHLQDDIFRARPTGQRSGETNTNDLGPTHIERKARHHVDCIGAADSDCHHAQSAGIGSVAVGADHHAAGEGVVLEDDLVDDAAPGTPESNAVFGAHRTQEVVHLAVGVVGIAQVQLRSDFGENQVITMHGGGDCRGRQTCRHELQQCHLRCGVLHCHAVGIEVGVAATPLHLLGAWVNQVIDQDFFCQREWTSESLSSNGCIARK